MARSTTTAEPPSPAADGAEGFSASAFAKYAKMKILVVDDEPANVALLEGLLGDNGYSRVNSVTDSRATIETCKSFQPDLILLDLMMPVVDGFAVLEALREYRSETFLPVLILTADVNEQTKLRALSAGANDFLLKPFEQIEALLRIANLLEIRHLHLQMEMQRLAYEEAVRTCSSELRDAKAALAKKKWSDS
jgi:putative two-component system response regulator